MKSGWHFRQFRPGDTVNDPIQGALFSQESVSDHPATALVRESIQNSLDAKAKDGKQVRVAFTVRTAGKSLDPKNVGFSDGLFEHLEGRDSGISEVPRRGGQLDYLIVEDFGTVGLIGDQGQWKPFDSRKNPFFLFFRAIGRSGKEGEQRGRWGIGKFVFPMASLTNTWIGLSVPVDGGPPALMGRCVIKTHEMGLDAWHPDGYWGLRDETTGQVMPFSDQHSVYQQLVAAIQPKRGVEAGLSVIVPWLRPEITGAAIRSAVVREYFLPVLRGDLVVTVAHNDEITTIDASTVEFEAGALKDPVLSEHVAMAIEAVTRPASSLHVLPRANSDGGPLWDDALLADDARIRLSSELTRGEVVGLRIPFDVRPKSGPASTTFFDVFIRQSPQSTTSPYVAREGIKIPDAKAKRVHDHIALVVVDDRPFASLVGDSENPSHTQLLHDLIKDKYVKGKMCLTLLREAPSGILRALSGNSTEDDASLLAALFPASDEGTGLGEDPLKKPGTRPRVKPDIPRPRPPRYRVSKVSGGFSVRGVDPRVVDSELLIACAYEVRRGNPLSRYKPLDFSIEGGTITLECTGAAVTEKSDNKLRVRPEQADFVITLSGFDPNRNLFVRVG